MTALVDCPRKLLRRAAASPQGRDTCLKHPADAPAATIQVRYVDTANDLQGPFPIKFDPEAALIRDQRKSPT